MNKNLYISNGVLWYVLDKSSIDLLLLDMAEGVVFNDNSFSLFFIIDYR